MGNFGNGTTELNLINIPSHESLTVEFDLYLLRTWDGSDTAGWGQDYWSFAVDGQQQFHETFANRIDPNSGHTNGTQSFGGQGQPSGAYPGFTGAAESGTLGYSTWRAEFQRYEDMSAVYRLTFTVPHTASTAELDFSASGLQGLSDESWGLDNVRVEMAQTPTVNLSADVNVDGVFNELDDAIEDDDMGKLVFVNVDDDNANSQVDRDEVGSVVGEDDLAEVRIDFPAEEYDGLTLRLTLSGDASAVRLWETPARTVAVGSVTYYVIGQDAIPSSVYVEGLADGMASLSAEVLDATGSVFVLNGNPVADDLKTRVTTFDLDVNDNLTTTDAVDGFGSYRPGYVGATGVLSSGTYAALSPLTPQPLHAVFNNLGTNAGLGRISASLTSVTDHEGYAENAVDPGDTFLNDLDDVSFSNTGDKHLTDTNDDGGVIADKSWLNFFVRDYAAVGNINVLVYDNQGVPRGSHSRQVVQDVDDDGMQDGWELEKVQEFKAQYGNITFVGFADDLAIFDEGEPEPLVNEYADPDGGDPTLDGDGGRNMPSHKAAGDSLTPFQEYRGFILDGGGFDGTGQNGHAGGHKRLSPAYKELLLEVDTMSQQNIAAMPAGAQLTSVLDTVAKGYSDRASGADVRVYWVVDEPNATYKVLTNDADASVWAEEHRNSRLEEEFVHMMFAGSPTKADAYGYTYPGVNVGGCFVFVTLIKMSALPADYLDWVANTTAHELGHAIIDPQGATGFDGGEHETNPDPADGVEGPLDSKYLMVRGAIRTPRTAIIFSDTVLAQIDLTRKTSVEI